MIDYIQQMPNPFGLLKAQGIRTPSVGNRNNPLAPSAFVKSRLSQQKTRHTQKMLDIIKCIIHKRVVYKVEFTKCARINQRDIQTSQSQCNNSKVSRHHHQQHSQCIIFIHYVTRPQIIDALFVTYMVYR